MAFCLPLVNIFDKEEPREGEGLVVVVEPEVVADGHPHVDPLGGGGQLRVAVAGPGEHLGVEAHWLLPIHKGPEILDSKISKYVA